MKCICFKSSIHWSTQICLDIGGFPFALRTNTVDHLWPTVLVDKVKGKPRNFEAYLCGSLYSAFKTSFQPYAFYNKRLKMLFKDQLDRSKATCSFKVGEFIPVQFKVMYIWPNWSKECLKVLCFGDIANPGWLSPGTENYP